MLLFRTLTRQGFYRMATVKNPYQILGLKNTATADEIKKVYRSIAQMYHPDKNPDPVAQKKFIQAKQAYEILIDEDKRRQYDNEHYSAGRSRGYENNPFDEFNDDIYKDKSRTYHQTFTSGSSRKKKGDNIVQEIQLNFIDAIKGIALDLSMQRKSICHTCGGNKCKPGTAPTRCLSCGGSGSTIYRRGGIVMHLQCQRCKGIGLMIKYPCLDCKATGIQVQQVIQSIVIPPGVQTGQTVTIPQKGNLSQNGPSGDLLLKIVVNKHPKFRKIGQDIHSTQWITISQAALGATRIIETAWGPKDIRIPQGTQDGSNLNIKGMGVQGMKGRGDHIVSFRIKIPTKLTTRQRQIFKELAQLQEPIGNGPSNNKDKDEDEQSIFDRMKNAFK